MKKNNIKITIVGKWNYNHIKISSWVQEAWEEYKQILNQGGFNAVLEKRRAYHGFDDDVKRWEDHLIITAAPNAKSLSQ